jgi:hypothetical protein
VHDTYSISVLAAHILEIPRSGELRTYVAPQPEAAVVLLEENLKRKQNRCITFSYPWGPSIVLIAHAVVQLVVLFEFTSGIPVRCYGLFFFSLYRCSSIFNIFFTNLFVCMSFFLLKD